MFLLFFLILSTLYNSAQTDATVPSLARTMFLPPDPRVNPFYDPEMEYIVATFNKNTSNLVQSRTTSYLQELFERELTDQLVTQAEKDTFLFLGLLGSGPTAINLLGQVLVLSSKKDFSFVDKLPNQTYKYIQYPTSFRATLIQIVNEAYTAFSSAHSNMDKIQLHMQQIPGHVKTSLKLLATAPFSLLEKLLPLSLSNIEHAGVECANLSLMTYNKFTDVILLLDEVIALTEAARGETTQNLDIIMNNITITEVEREQLNHRENDIRQRYLHASEFVKTTQETFHRELAAIPTGLLNSWTGKSDRAAKKAQEARNALEEAIQRYDSAYLELMAFHDKMTQLIIRIASLNMTQIDYKEIIPIMIEAVKLLGEIKSRWDELVRFFDKLSNRAKITLDASLNNFVNWMKEAQLMGPNELTPYIRSYYLDYLKEDALAIHSEAHLLYIMARSYFDVSNEFLMPQLAGLAKLVTATTPEERMELNNQLQIETEKVQLNIRSLTRQRQSEYLIANQNRQTELELFIENAQLQSLEEGVGRKRKRNIFYFH